MVLRLAGDQQLSIRQSCQLVNLSRATYYRDENRLAVRDAPVIERSMRLLPSIAVGDSGNA
jgi:putative transposase